MFVFVFVCVCVKTQYEVRCSEDHLFPVLVEKIIADHCKHKGLKSKKKIVDLCSHRYIIEIETDEAERSMPSILNATKELNAMSGLFELVQGSSFLLCHVSCIIRIHTTSVTRE